MIEDPKNIRYFIPPVVLVMVALLQLILQQTTNITPWKGGGFGMFTAPFERIVHFHVYQEDDTFFCVSPPKQYRRFLETVKRAPNEKNIRTALSLLSDKKWVNPNPNRRKVISSEHDATIPALPINRIQAEIYQAKFDKESMTLLPEKIMERELLLSR